MSSSPLSLSGAASPSKGGTAEGGGQANQADLAIKYHKLATEYSKLRAQFGVVRKAVVDEQARGAELAESLRLKEVQERRWEAEMDSLTFRNQQLTKRIQVLQEEMETSTAEKKNSKKSKKLSSAEETHSSHPSSAVKSSEALNSVIGQELQSKIEENARLHDKLSDIDKKYEDLVGSLQSRIRELESETKRRAQAERAEDSKQRDLIQGLKEENVELAGRVRQMEREIVDGQDRVTVLTVQLESANASSTSSSTEMPQSLVIPPATSSSSLRQQQHQLKKTSSSSFPLTANDARIQSVELLSQFGEYVTDLVASFSDFHTYWEHRLKDTHHDGPLTDNAARLSRLLLQNVRHLKPIEEAFQSILSQVLSRREDDMETTTFNTLSYFRPFAAAFRGYVVYACEAEAMTVACLQHESNLFSCPPTQQAKNGQLQTALRAMNRVLVRVADYLDCLGESSSSTTGRSEEAVEDVNAATSQLFQHVRELSGIYSAKAADENQLPTVTDQLKNTNQCIVAALSAMVGCVNGLSRQLSDNLPRILMLIRASGQALPVMPPPPQLTTTSNTTTTVNKVAVVQEEGRKDNNSQVDSLKEQKGQLEQVIADLSERIKKVEQNREHWKLECQLLQMKHDRLRNNNVEEVRVSTDQDKLLAAEQQEEDVKRPFRERIDEMVTERLTADSKALTFHLECVAVRKRLRAAEGRRRRMEEELRVSAEQVLLLREEVGTTATNYEGQLGMMTEHVANMNEKLTEQTDQIENLKYELSRGGGGGKRK